MHTRGTSVMSTKATTTRIASYHWPMARGLSIRREVQNLIIATLVKCWRVLLSLRNACISLIPKRGM